MTVKVIDQNKQGNRLSEFPEGRLGIIRKWNSSTNAEGRIVILRNGILYCLQDAIFGGSYHSWPHFFSLFSLKGDYYIEVLPPGTQIEITV